MRHAMSHVSEWLGIVLWVFGMQMPSWLRVKLVKVEKCHRLAMSRKCLRNPSSDELNTIAPKMKPQLRLLSVWASLVTQLCIQVRAFTLVIWELNSLSYIREHLFYVNVRKFHRTHAHQMKLYSCGGQKYEKCGGGSCVGWRSGKCLTLPPVAAGIRVHDRTPATSLCSFCFSCCCGSSSSWTGGGGGVDVVPISSLS